MNLKHVKLIQYNLAESLKNLSKIDASHAGLGTKLLLGNAQYRISAINNDILCVLDRYQRDEEEAEDERESKFYRSVDSGDGLQQAQAADLLSGKKDSEDDEKANTDFIDPVRDINEVKSCYSKKRFAGGCLAQTDFFPIYYDRSKKRWLLDTRKPSHEYDADLIRAYLRSKAAFVTSLYFQVTGHNTLAMVKDGTPLIVSVKDSSRYSETEKVQKDRKKVEEAANGPKNGIVLPYGKENDDSILDKYIVTDEFIRYIGMKDNWNDIADGQFELAATRVVKEDMNE